MIPDTRDKALRASPPRIKADRKSPVMADFTRRDVNRALLVSAYAALFTNWGGSRRPAVLFNFAIAGGFYHGLEVALPRIRPGTPLDLCREPENPYDPDAVAVHFERSHLGYVPREANEPVARLMDTGRALRADVVRMLDVYRSEEVPEDLVYTVFASGDPMVRLVVT